MNVMVVGGFGVMFYDSLENFKQWYKKNKQHIEIEYADFSKETKTIRIGVQ